MRRTASEWSAILLAAGVARTTAALWGMVLFEEIKEDTFSKGDADVIDFLPNVIHESQKLERMEESLNYSADRLVEIFGSHRITPEQARRVGRIDDKQAANQRAIANIIYGGEWGRKNLGNILPDDGWTFRGRSPIQITGRANYQRVGDLVQQNLVGIPDLLSQPRFGLEACIAWWEDRIPDSMLGETTSIRKRVNGGTLGLAEVVALTKKIRDAMEPA